MADDVSRKKKDLNDHLGIEIAKVTEESSFIDDLNDSLDTVELVMAEEEFGSEISIVKLKNF